MLRFASKRITGIFCSFVYQGKPLAEAEAEVASGASFFEWYSETARHVAGDVIEAPAKGRQMFAIKEPVGVAAMITPVSYLWKDTIAPLIASIFVTKAAHCSKFVFFS